MSSPAEQYADSLRNGQKAVAEAIESWTKNAQQAFGSQSATPDSFDPNQVIDQVFDFAEQMLHAQREYAKTLTSTAASAAAAARKQAATAVGSTGDDAGPASKAPRPPAK